MWHDISPCRIEVVDDALVQFLKEKSPAERIAIVADANHTARILAAAGARYLHPTWDKSQILAEVARRIGGGTDLPTVSRARIPRQRVRRTRCSRTAQPIYRLYSEWQASRKCQCPEISSQQPKLILATDIHG